MGTIAFRWRRPVGSYLEGSETTVGSPHHPDIPIGPWLLSQPFHGVVTILLFDGHILVSVYSLDPPVPRASSLREIKPRLAR
jgi:hypothetical protein